MIRWMQNKHGLWALGELEAPILDYLETHYAPRVSGSRRPLAEHLLPGELINGAISAAEIQPPAATYHPTSPIFEKQQVG